MTRENTKRPILRLEVPSRDELGVVLATALGAFALPGARKVEFKVRDADLGDIVLLTFKGPLQTGLYSLTGQALRDLKGTRAGVAENLEKDAAIARFLELTENMFDPDDQGNPRFTRAEKAKGKFSLFYATVWFDTLENRETAAEIIGDIDDENTSDQETDMIAEGGPVAVEDEVPSVITDVPEETVEASSDVMANLAELASLVDDNTDDQDGGLGIPDFLDCRGHGPDE